MGHGRCVDARHALECRDFTWHLDVCGGPDGCRRDGAVVASCDQRTASPGEACAEPGARACTADGAALVQCEGGRETLALACRGPQRCHRDGPGATAECDQGPAEVGDPCQSEGSHCSAGGHAILRCTGARRYVLEQACPGRRGCFRDTGKGDRLYCDVSTGEVGDRCPTDGADRCSGDGLRELTCRGGLLVPKQGCPGGCTVEWQADGATYLVACS